MRRSRIPPLRLALLALATSGCAASTAEFIESNPGFRVTAGYVIRLENLESPKVHKLKDGVAYTATQPGAFLVMEQRNPSRFRRAPARLRLDLNPGDIFIKSRPLSFALQASKATTKPAPR